MNVAEQIRNTIECIPESQPFGYADLGIEATNFYSAAKSLERLQKKGVIKKVSKGVFYRPEISTFGELPADSNAILNRYLFRDGKRIAYITSYSLFNSLGLTTQMAFKIKIATNEKRIKIDEYYLNVNSVKSYVEVTDQNYKLLGYLDAIKDIKKIPDCSVKQAVIRMRSILKPLNATEISELINLALNYPTRTRALLGAILENIDSKLNLDKLKNSLNPLTKINLNIDETVLQSTKKWNINATTPRRNKF